MTSRTQRASQPDAYTFAVQARQTVETAREQLSSTAAAARVIEQNVAGEHSQPVTAAARQVRAMLEDALTILATRSASLADLARESTS